MPAQLRILGLAGGAGGAGGKRVNLWTEPHRGVGADPISQVRELDL